MNISAWQTTLKNELDSLKGLVLAAKTAGKSNLTKGTNYTIAQGEGIYEKWGLATLQPSKAVAETSEAARRVRCERLELEPGYMTAFNVRVISSISAIALFGIAIWNLVPWLSRRRDARRNG